MQISKKSWLFRLNCLLSNNFEWQHKYQREPISLCKYFWLTVWNIIAVLPFLVVLGTLVVSLATIAIFGVFMIPFVSLEELPKWQEVCIAFSSIIWVGVTGATLVHFAAKGIKKLSSKVRGKVKYKEPSLLSQYIQARKEKFCPTITFTNEEK